jgi:ribosomal 50S subunit-recycling heat shock protein
VRIDLYLKKTLIFKKREDAKKMCDKNLVKLNGRYIKPSKTINSGDLIEIETAKGLRQFQVLKIPTGNVKKEKIELYYKEIHQH